ncbi:unnamed protein product [Cuscuta epithymum]|uniref:Uncharacterized protein n=1 Tax=Cuscuta epithymum TaxID=186058 RepID=A0AAV0DEX8_9ASTE|nr:unnamed protein product [Cuscuta epithymum]CAH9099687.1 unnamed protein product [Cuscuta epithymum]
MSERVERRNRKERGSRKGKLLNSYYTRVLLFSKFVSCFEDKSCLQSPRSLIKLSPTGPVHFCNLSRFRVNQKAEVFGLCYSFSMPADLSWIGKHPAAREK